MSKIGDCVEVADAGLRIRERFEYESVTAATTRHRVTTATTIEGVVLRAAYERIGIRVTKEYEGIMRRAREFQRGAAVDCRSAGICRRVGDQRAAAAVARQYEVRRRVITVRKDYAIDRSSCAIGGFENC